MGGCDNGCRSEHCALETSRVSETLRQCKKRTNSSLKILGVRMTSSGHPGERDISSNDNNHLSPCTHVRAEAPRHTITPIWFGLAFLRTRLHSPNLPYSEGIGSPEAAIRF